MQFIDTHCHLHFDNYLEDAEEVLANANRDKVAKIICVGCSLADSKKAIDFANKHANVWATAGAHPHDGADFMDDPSASEKLLNMLSNSNKVVAIGEIGLDYYHENTPREKQQEALRAQIEVGLKTGLPFVFHVREAPQQKLDASQSDYRLLRSGFAAGQAFQDFWKIIDSYNGIKGVIHSFSAGESDLEEVLKRGFYVGLNGIMTFTKDQNQLDAAKKVPLDKLLLETDAPFLTPKPFRGKRCEPKHVVNTAEFLTELRGESLEELANVTTKNAERLFKI